MTKATDLRAKTDDQLKDELLKLRREQMNLRFQKAGGGLEKTDGVRKNRRTIARVKTFLDQQAKGAAAPAAKKTAKAAPKAAKKKA